MPICASAARSLLTFADPLSWAVSRVLGPGRGILAQRRAIDGFANTGNSRVVSQFEVGTGPHPRPATHANILSLGGRAGVRAGADFFSN